MNKNAAPIPVCPKIDYTHTLHGDTRPDPYYWLRERENPEVRNYLEAENAYQAAVMADTEPLQEKLYAEMLGRIKQDDESVPYFLRGYWYYTRYTEGKEYPIFCRRKESMEAAEEVMLNVNEMAEGYAYYQVGGLSVSEDNEWLAFGVDTVSRRIYTIYFKNLKTGEIHNNHIEGTTGSTVWSADSATVFYTTKDDQTLRSNRIFRFHLPTGAKELVFEEKDETFYAHIHKTKSRKFLVIGSTSTLTSEYRILEANNPYGSFRIFQECIRGMEYSLAHFEDVFYVLTNWEATNFRLMKCPLEATTRTNWEEVIAHREDVLLEGLELFRSFMVLEERKDAQTHIRVIESGSGMEHYVSFDEEAYTAGTSVNPEYETEILRFGYTSLTTPSSTYDYNMRTRERELKKEQPVLGSFNKGNYRSERLYVEVRDGVRVPVSLVYHKDHQPAADRPMLLYAYGSYGHSMDPYFSSVRLSLLDRGVSFAIAHIRGGEEMGRAWYEDGKLLRKRNTFNDFIDCAEFLIAGSYTSSKHLYAMGGSAGGLLMGAVANMRPDLWNGVLAAVPFVDVVTTMLDQSIPLTTGEFDEWGNPEDAEYYEYIKSYSPYDNVSAQDYPNMLITTGFHDSQVQYWEPAKWTARLRELKTDDNILLFRTEMDFGHSGASGRFQQLKEIALEYAFILDLEGIKD
ncbi:MAG: S9 family peptidase [Flavobacteriales bacterium]|nr:S9 family peptidase [Flavobacteriales bacterium]